MPIADISHVHGAVGPLKEERPLSTGGATITADFTDDRGFVVQGTVQADADTTDTEQSLVFVPLVGDDVVTKTWTVETNAQVVFPAVGGVAVLCREIRTSGTSLVDITVGFL